VTVIDRTNTRVRIKTIFCVFFDITIFSYFLTGADSRPGRATSSWTAVSCGIPFFFNTIAEVVPIKEKKSIAAGISWRRTITAPMMMKIQRATPASFRLIDRANAGVAIKLTKIMIIPVSHVFVPFDIPHSPFLFGLDLKVAFRMPRGNQEEDID
jgi:hypothetical protein